MDSIDEKIVALSSESEDEGEFVPNLSRGRRRGANAKRQCSNSPASSAASAIAGTSKKGVKEEDADDPLLYLSVLFDAVDLGDESDGSDAEPEPPLVSSSADREPSPPTPRSKNLSITDYPQRKTYFYAMGCLCYYDQDFNVFRENSPGQVSIVFFGEQRLPRTIDFNETPTPDFYICGVPYQFDITGALLFQEQGCWTAVYTWSSDPDPSNFDQALNTMFTPPNMAPQTYNAYGLEFNQYTQVPAFHEQAKQEMATPSNRLDNSFRRNIPWSPGSSKASPIVSTASRASSESFERPLIDSNQQGWIAGIQYWRHQTKIIQEELAPPNKMDRRKCPQCNKVFRRPSSLDDHLNVHSGAKPHMCPYRNCKTGFATKSNMKRHFLTHRVGTLDEYHNGVKVEERKPRTTTYNSKAFHTQRFRVAPT